MSVEKLHDLEQKRDNIARQMRSLNDTIGDNDWSDEQRSEFQTAKSELRNLDSRIDMAKELRRLNQEDAQRSQQTEDEMRNLHDANKDGNLDYRSAFDSLMRHGFNELSKEERSVLKDVQQRAQSKGDDAKGGYTVPDEFQSRVIEQMKAYGGIANNCNVLTTSDGRTFDWSTTDGTADIGDFIAENTKAGQQDVDFGTIQVGAKKLTSKVILISNELLNDTGIAMDALLTGRIASRIGRAEAKYIVSGNGTGLQNKGLESSVTGTTAIKTAATVNWKDINALIHSIDPAYRNMSSFSLAFNDNTLQLLEEQEDNQGRPLWLPAIAGGTPATILGKRYFIDQGIADGGTTKKFMYAGDWNKFMLRRVRYMQLKRLNELYAESDQVGFLAFHRFDTLLEDTSAIKALTWKTA
ncbi:major head protein [Vibrio phage K394]